MFGIGGGFVFPLIFLLPLLIGLDIILVIIGLAVRWYLKFRKIWLPHHTQTAKKLLKFLLIVNGILIGLMVLEIVVNAIYREKLTKLEAEKDKSRYFTIETPTPYGEIVLPVGTHVYNYIASELNTPNQPKNLNNVQEIRFPQPIKIKGMSVIALHPIDYIYFQITEPVQYRFSKDAPIATCPAGGFAIMGDTYKAEIYTSSEAFDERNYPKYFTPSKWRVESCSYDEAGSEEINPPYWENGKLIDPKHKNP